jgi:3-phenylpropionate/cinnamic acid dioxygenase small subunit
VTVLGTDERGDLDLAALAGRLEQLEAAEHARGAMAAYADAVDAQDLDALAAVFSADAVVDVPGREYSGLEQVLGFYTDAFAADPSRKTHFVTNLSTEALDRGRTGVRCYLLYTASAEDMSVIGWGNYEAIVRVEPPTRVIERLSIAVRRAVDVRTGWAGPAGPPAR